jgi:uncharacterized protein (TIGR00369 family)
LNPEEATGLQQLQHWIAAGKRFGIAETLQFSLVEASEGFAAFEGIPGDHAYNPIGSVHGGYAATLLDSACGCAVQSKLAPGVQYTTLELKVSYHKAVTRTTGLVRAEAKVLSIGRRVGFAEAKLFDASGKLLASATSTLLVINR